MNARVLAALAAIGTLYLLLAVGLALTKRPWCDEAWYASPGVNLATKGVMSTTVLDPQSPMWRSSRVDGIDRHTYWAMPLHFFVQAAWYRVAGFGLFSLRLLGVLWGLAALAAWYFVLRTLSGSQAVALVALLLLSTEYFFLERAADGRMDMMSAALGAGALAVYLYWREQYLARAVAAGATLATASLFTHPNGGVLAAIGLLCLAVCFDRMRLRFRHVLIAAVPFAAAMSAWTMYILQDPASFRIQFFSAVAGRWTGLLHPWAALKSEIALRYLKQYGFAWWSHGWAHLEILTPLVYAAALAAGLAVRDIRRARGSYALVLLAAVYFAYMTLLEGLKTWLYLVHILPVLTGVVALCVYWLWRRRYVPWPALALLIAGIVSIQAARTIRLIHTDPYRSSYLPALSFLRSKAGPRDLVMGSAELAFQLGFTPEILDDLSLGYHTGKQPAFIVLDERHYRDNLDQLAHERPEIHRYVSTLLADRYERVYDNGFYMIYARPAPAAKVSSSRETRWR